jgi:hypothetical protein
MVRKGELELMEVKSGLGTDKGSNGYPRIRIGYGSDQVMNYTDRIGPLPDPWVLG